MRFVSLQTRSSNGYLLRCDRPGRTREVGSRAKEANRASEARAVPGALFPFPFHRAAKRFVSASWSKSLSPRAPGAANPKSLRCNSLSEARRNSFLGVPGTNVERFLHGVSLPGLLLLNWQSSHEALNDAERVYKRAPIRVAKEVIPGQTKQLSHFCDVAGITS